jgi:hypothetical protein
MVLSRYLRSTKGQSVNECINGPLSPGLGQTIENEMTPKVEIESNSQRTSEALLSAVYFE